MLGDLMLVCEVVEWLGVVGLLMVIDVVCGLDYGVWVLLCFFYL